MFEFWLKTPSTSYVKVEDPINGASLSEKISIDEKIKLISRNYDFNMTFIGGGYKIINDEFILNGYCSEIDVLVKKKGYTGSFIDFFEGKIFVSECKFNIGNNNSVECQIRDVGWQSKIENNKKSEIILTAINSKNGESITAVTDLQLDLFLPNTGAYQSGYESFDVKEILGFLVSWMTDDSISFESSWYDNLPSDEKLAVILGKTIRDSTFAVEAPKISFETIFTELNKLYNLFIILDYDVVNPILRIEDENYVRSSQSGVEIRDIKELERSTDVKKLYSTVKVGSKDFIKLESNSSPNLSLPYFTANTFAPEEYQTEGICNVDKVLDLSSEFITDHNVIEDIIRNGNTDHDDDIFLIQYTPGSPNIATKNYYLSNVSGNPSLYNGVLRNAEVINRWRFPTNLIKYIGTQDNGCVIERNTQQSFVGVNSLFILPTEYQDESCSSCSDTNGNFNNTGVGVDSYGYTAPVDGTYSFDFSCSLMNIVFNGAGIVSSGTITLNLYRYDSVGTLLSNNFFPVSAYNIENSPPVFIKDNLSSIDVKDIVDSGLQNIQIRSNFFNFYLDSGDIVKTAINFNFASIGALTVDLDVGSPHTGTDRADFFSCIASGDGGGLIAENNPSDFIVNKYSFKRVISDDDWDIIRNDPSQSIAIFPEKIRLDAYIDSIERNVKTGESTIKLKSKL